MWLYHSVIVPLLVLGVLIFVHELGHFLLAKWCRVGVLKFAIGFGPALYRKRIAETEYQIGIIPLGGFVRMVGDMPDMITGSQVTDKEVRKSEDTESTSKEDAKESEKAKAEEDLPPNVKEMIADRSRWFLEQGILARSAIVFAGPLFNFIFAFIVITFSALFYGVISDSAKIGDIMPGSPAERSGLKSGDIVNSIDGVPIASWRALAEKIYLSEGKELALDVNREGSQHSLSVTPEKKEIDTPSGNESIFLIGINPKITREKISVVDSITIGAQWTYRITIEVYKGLWGMITGKVSTKDLRGPLFILGEASNQAREGFEHLARFCALLSISLAVLNLLPIPILDGGHLLFFFIEAVFGPLSIRTREFAQQVGVVFLLCLMAYAIHNDLTQSVEAPTSKKVSWEASGEKTKTLPLDDPEIE